MYKWFAYNLLTILLSMLPQKTLVYNFLHLLAAPRLFPSTWCCSFLGPQLLIIAQLLNTSLLPFFYSFSTLKKSQQLFSAKTTSAGPLYQLSSLLFIFNCFFKKTFICLCQFLVTACGISQLWPANSQFRYVGSSSLTRDGTWAACVGSSESQPLDHYRSPSSLFFKSHLSHTSTSLSLSVFSLGSLKNNTTNNKCQLKLFLFPSLWVSPSKLCTEHRS